MPMRYCVIMCGGVGSRFWPLSREAMPKQFLDFFGTGRSMLQLTADRVRDIVPSERIVIVTNEDYLDEVRIQLPDVPVRNILLEPARRNTAPGILWAVRHILALDTEATVAVFPSDHLILREEEFRNVVRESFEFAESHTEAVVLGIEPTGPSTTCSYVQRGPAIDGCKDTFAVKTFVGKPDDRMARIFLSTGEFLWNTGIFMQSAAALLHSYSIYAPELYSLFDGIADCYGRECERERIAGIYSESESVTVGRGVLYKCGCAYVRRADIGWRDLATWSELYNVSPKTIEGNVTQNCRVLAGDCEGSVFSTTDDKIIVAAGLKDYIVADTPKALLVWPMGREQEIKSVVNEVRNLYGTQYI